MLCDGDGVPVNKSEAARLYKMAIEKGNDYARKKLAKLLNYPIDKESL